MRRRGASAAPRGRPYRVNLLGLLVFAVMVFPVYWMVSTAFKRPFEILSFTPEFIPSPATLANFENAVNRPNFWSRVQQPDRRRRRDRAFDGARVPGGAGAGEVPLLRPSAFVVLIIGVQMVPLNALIIPLYILLSRADQVDKLTGVIVTYLTFVLPFCVWTLRGFMLGVPRELEEAAMVDGSTRFGAFVRILLPLVAPGLVATSIFAFIQVWNEFIIAYVLLQSQDKQTLTVWLA